MSSQNFEILDPPDNARTLTAGVAERLRADILNGVLAPGSRLAMAELTARYGVGMSPVREALSRLVGEGLVQTEGQRGFRVAAMSRDDFNEIVMLRQMVEETGIRAAIARGDEKWEASLVAAFHLLERRLSALLTDATSERMAAYEEAHKAFHVALLAGAGSTRLSRMQQRLYEEARRYRLLVYKKHLAGNAVDFGEAGAIHREILDAVLARNADRAASILRRHVALIEDFDLDG